MKIIQVIQTPQLRGAEIFAAQLSTHLSAQGHEVIIVSLFKGNAILPLNVPIKHLNANLNKRLIDFKSWKKLADYIKEIRPDVIQTNAGDTLKFTVISKLLFCWRTPIVLRNANKVSDLIGSKLKWWFNKFLIDQVSSIISVSDLCRIDFIKTYSIDEKKITSIPIGIDLTFKNFTISQDLINLGKNFLIHVGSFVPEKNHEGLIRIVEKLIQKNQHVSVVLVGDGKLRPLIERMIYRNNLHEKILLLGYQNDVFSIMRKASIFMLPSKIEGLPGVILEAMYCKIPVVAYNVGGISEIVKNGETGWLIKANDEEGFVAALNEILRGGHDSIIQNAYNMVVRDFDNQQITKRFLSEYEKLI